MLQVRKVLQRKIYNSLNSNWFLSVLLIGLFSVITLLSLSLLSQESCSLRGNQGSHYFCSVYNFRNNIGDVQGELYTAFEPIDVVYTWVNGSDPVWRKKKEWWAKKNLENQKTYVPAAATVEGNHSLINNNNNNTTTSTSSVPPIHHNASLHTSDLSTNTSTTSSTSTSNTTAILSNATAVRIEEEDDTMSSNRFRDSEELRYSLRSLVKHAPWIRHIYLVTDNQIPYWLNLETSKLSIVSHSDIFANQSHLPVFSSPAIEANLHRIPGLSKRFIYFNDDVMLGSPTVPDDFVTLSGAQKFYMAWDVPKCAPGCSDSWIGDGFCDKACNVSACNFDFPDCINGSNVNNNNNAGSPYSASGYTNRASVQCSKGCPTTWLADKICDLRCKNIECGWDLGDCGLNLIVEHYPGVALSAETAVLSIDETFYDTGPYRQQHYYSHSGDFEEEGLEPSPADYNATDSSPASSERGSGGLDSELYHDLLLTGYSDKIALEVPVGTKSVYFNLSYLPCRVIAHNYSCPDLALLSNLSASSSGGFSYISAEHNDFEQHIIHHSVLLQKHHMLVVTLFHGTVAGGVDEEDSLPTIPAYPYVIEFTVMGGDTAGGQTVMMIFKLVIVEEKSKAYNLEAHVPEGLGLLAGNSYSSVILPASFYNNTSSHNNTSQGEESERDRVQVLPVPFRTMSYQSQQYGYYEVITDHEVVLYRDGAGVAEGVILDYDLPSLSSYLSQRSSRSIGKKQLDDPVMLLRVLVTLRNDTSYLTYLRLCDFLLQYTISSSKHDGFKSYLATASSSSSSEEGFSLVSSEILCQRDPAEVWQLLTSNYYSKYQVSSLYKLLVQYDQKQSSANHDSERSFAIPRPSFPPSHVVDKDHQLLAAGLVFIPLPIKYQELEEEWITIKTELFETSHHSLSTDRARSKISWRKLKSSEFHYEKEAERSQLVDQERLWSIESLVRWGTNLSALASMESTTSTTNQSSITDSSSSIPSLSSENTTTTITIVTESSTVNSSTTSTTSLTNEMEEEAVLPVTSLNDSLLPLDDTTSDKSNTTTTFSRRRRRSRRRRLATDTVPSSFFSLSLYHHLFSWVQSVFNQPVESNPSHHHHRHRHRRRLTDTYGQSLIHVNRLYNKVFGVESRKVPAHVPHMIDQEIMAEMQTKWSTEWNETSSHRFRSTTDMQYSFSYYYYTIHRHKIASLNEKAFIENYVDHNSDGIIDPNEFRTLVAIVKGKQLEPGEVEKYQECVRNGTERILEFQESRVFDHPSAGKVKKSLAYTHYPTIAEVLNCSLIQTVLQENKDLVKRLFLSHSPIVGSDKDVVAFEMIGDNLTETLSQLDSVRHRQSKFICINDNMKHPSPELEQALKDFYLSLFPTPSIFELPPSQPNPTLYFDEYQRLKQQRQRYYLYYWFTEDLVDFWSRYRSYWLSNLKQSLRYWVASLEELEEAADRANQQRKQQQSEEVIMRLRKDLGRDPLTEPIIPRRRSGEKSINSGGGWWGLMHFHLFLSVVGVLVLILLRQKQKQKQKREPSISFQEEDEEDPETHYNIRERSRSRSRSSSLIHNTIISSEAEEPTENKLYAINKLGADEYAWALRVAAMEEIDETILERDYFMNESDESPRPTGLLSVVKGSNSNENNKNPGAVAGLSKKKKRNKKKKSLEMKEE